MIETLRLTKKITTCERDRDFCMHIDQEKLEATIESVVENAMQAVEVALKNFDIHIDSIDLDMRDLDVDIDIDQSRFIFLKSTLIDPIDIDFVHLDIDIDVDEDDFGWHEDNDE